MSINTLEGRGAVAVPENGGREDFFFFLSSCFCFEEELLLTKDPEISRPGRIGAIDESGKLRGDEARFDMVVTVAGEEHRGTSSVTFSSFVRGGDEDGGRGRGGRSSSLGYPSCVSVQLVLAEDSAGGPGAPPRVRGWRRGPLLLGVGTEARGSREHLEEVVSPPPPKITS